MLIDLGVTPISSTLYRLAVERRSGDLLVNSAESARMVCFHHGQIVFACSNLKQERLGEALVALGQITGDQFNCASRLMAEPDRKLRFGDALVQAGFMKKDAVGAVVAQWVAKIVVSLFRLDAGTASFEERPCPVPLDYMVSLSVQRLLLAGISTMSNPELIRAGVGDLDRLVKMAPVPPFHFSVNNFLAEEREVLDRAKAPAVLRGLVSTPKGVSLGRLRAAYALLASGILQPAGDVFNATPAVQAETGGFLGSRPLPSPSAPEASAPDVKPAARAETSSAARPRIETAEPVAGASPVRRKEPSPAASAPEQPAKAAAPFTPRPGHSLEIERLQTQADVCLMVADLPGAIQAYLKLVDFAPQVAAHRARLAALMARLPRTLRQAERQFIEALRLDPDNAELHFQFGLYYRSMKVPSRAIAEFRTVLKLDPRHKEARAQLETAAPHGAPLARLKKLLR